jgi:hypothetical protein
MRRSIVAILGSVGVLALSVWATSWAAAAASSQGVSPAGVSARKAVPGKSHHGRRARDKRRLRYDDWGYHRGATASWKITKQWKWPEDPPVGVLSWCVTKGTADIAGTGENTAIKEALELWDKNSERLSFTESCKSPKVIFKWEVGDHKDGAPFDGQGGTLAHSDPPEGGEVCFDDDETWTLEERKTTGQPIDLLTVAIHEIGHIIGLDHSTDAGSIMLPNYTVSKRYLGKDDLEGLWALLESLTD